MRQKENLKIDHGGKPSFVLGKPTGRAIKFWDLLILYSKKRKYSPYRMVPSDQSMMTFVLLLSDPTKVLNLGIKLCPTIV